MSERNNTVGKGQGLERDLWDSMVRFWASLEEIRERAAAEGLPLWIDQEVTSSLEDWDAWVEQQLD